MPRFGVHVLVGLTVATFLTKSSHAEWNPTSINVRDCGAKGDGKTNDTEAFLAAFKQCESLDAAIIYVPDGVYLLWPMQLPKCRNSILYIHGTILAPSAAREWQTDAFFDVRGAYNFTIMGDFKGIIDGRGEEWWTLDAQRRAASPRNPNPLPSAPALLKFSHFDEQTPSEYGEPPRVVNISLRSAPGAHALIEGGQMYSSASLEGVIVESPPNVTTTAGFIAVNASVFISHCSVYTGGHNVLLYSPAGETNRIFSYMDDNDFGYGEGVTLIMQDGLAGNLSIYGNRFHETANGIRILTPQGGTGTISGFFVYNNNMTDVGIPLTIDMFYCPQGGCQNQTSGVKFYLIEFGEISATQTSGVAGRFLCSKTAPCSSIAIDNVVVKPTKDKKGVKKNKYQCLNAYGSEEKSQPKPCLQKEPPPEA